MPKNDIPRSFVNRRPEPEIPKTQGVGTWRLAEQYLTAAKTLQPVNPADGFVSYFLYGHALELTLKSFLVSQGSNNKKLKRIGHDLGRALRSASRHAPFKNIPVSDRDRVVIAGLAGYYRDKEFEYLITGYKRLPLLEDVRDVCERMQRQVKPLIWAAVQAHVKSGTASPP